MQRGAECPPGPTSGHRWKQRLAVRGSLGGGQISNLSALGLLFSWHHFVNTNPTENYFRSMKKILFSYSKRFALLLLLHTKTKGFILIQTLPPHTSHPKYSDLLAKNEWVCHKNNQLQVEDILENPLFRNMVQMMLMVVQEPLASWGREPLCSCNTSIKPSWPSWSSSSCFSQLVVLMVMQGPVSSSTKPCHSPPLCPRALPNNFIALPPTQIHKYTDTWQLIQNAACYKLYSLENPFPLKDKHCSAPFNDTMLYFLLVNFSLFMLV